MHPHPGFRPNPQRRREQSTGTNTRTRTRSQAEARVNKSERKLLRTGKRIRGRTWHMAEDEKKAMGNVEVASVAGLAPAPLTRRRRATSRWRR